MISGRQPRVLVTRAAEDAPSLSHALSEAGFLPVEAPALQRLWEIDAVARLARQTEDADILVVTSGTVADVLATAAPGAWRNCTVAAVGTSTKRRMESLGFTVSVVPDRTTAADLVLALGDLSGAHVVWPHGDLAPASTAASLEAAGAVVHPVVAYRNIEPPRFPAKLDQALPVDVTTLLSGSAARRVAARVSEADRWKLGRIVAIGPSTASASEEAGLPVDAVAEPYTLEGLIAAIRRATR